MRKERTKSYQLNRQKYLSESELEGIKSALSSAQLEHRLLVLLPIYSGARAQEVLNITPQDLIIEDMALQIYGLKHSDDRIVPLPEWLFLELQAFISLGNKPLNQSIFSIKYRQYANIWSHYAPKSIKAARHTFAVTVYKKTNNIKLIQKALGHRSIANTMIYSDYVFVTSEMRKLMAV